MEEALVYKIDGSNGEKMAQQLDSVEYYLVLDCTADGTAGAATGSGNGSGSGGGSEGVVARLQAAVAGATAAPEFLVQRQTKKRGKVKFSQVDLKWALLELQACTRAAAPAAGVPPEVLAGDGKAVVRLRSACANGNPVLSPAMAAGMLNAAAAAAGGAEQAAPGGSTAAEGGDEGGDGSAEAPVRAYELAHIHRSDIALRPMAVPQPDFLKLRSLLRMEGHLAAAQRAGAGAWAGGLENRPRLE